METLKDCLDFMIFLKLLIIKISRIFDTFEKMRECINNTYRDKNLEMKRAC